MNKRTFLKTASVLATAGLATGIYTWQIEPFWLEFVSVKMPVGNLPKSLTGKTLMQISDVHVGNRFDYQYIIESFQEAQRLQPDFVVYTGDYVSYENEEQFTQLEEVLQYAVKGKLGTFGILGNHDYGKAWAEVKVADRIIELLENADIQVLRNEQQKANGLNFIGFDDSGA